MRQTLIIIPLLIALTLATFHHASRCDFVNFDDDQYVTANRHVQAGLTVDSIRWAFTTVHTGYWHPLTWLSLMADRQFQGPGPAGFHRTNVALHALNVVLLFLLLWRATGARWRAALVAALFAIHPLRAESVAWVSERKDVLTACLGLLTLLAYLRYTRDPRAGRYLVALGCYVLALMAKPMLVTLPALLLLLDLWPLGRWMPGLAPSTALTVAPPIPRRPVAWVLLEKLPFLAAALAVAVGAVLGQRRTGAMVSLEHVDFVARIANAPVAYVRYMGHLFWPVGLYLDYPHPPGAGWPGLVVATSAALLVVITFAALRAALRFPHLAAGWFWFLGLLVPVIGLVQVGNQSMADRYTYLPSVGLMIMIAWSLPVALWCCAAARVATLAIIALVLTLLHSQSVEQVTVWEDSQSLWTHALMQEDGHAVAWNNLGVALEQRCNYARARHCFQRSVTLGPRLLKPRLNLAQSLLRAGLGEPAIAQIQEAMAMAPSRPEPLTLMGMALAVQGRHADALGFYRRALEADPAHARAQHQKANALAAMERYDDALEAYEKAIELSPQDAQALCDLGLTLRRITPRTEPRRALARQVLERAAGLNDALIEAHVALAADDLEADRVEPALHRLRRALGIDPGHVEANMALAAAARGLGRFDEALEAYERLLQSTPDPDADAAAVDRFRARVHLEIGLTLAAAGRRTDAAAFLREALALDPSLAAAHNALGIEMAIGGVMDQAARHFGRAVELAPANESFRANFARAKAQSTTPAQRPAPTSAPAQPQAATEPEPTTASPTR